MSSLNPAKSVELLRREDNTEERLAPLAMVERLTDTEIAYLAGLIDGEGSIMMRRQGSSRGEQRARFRAQLIIAATTSLDLISWVTERLGNRWYSTPRMSPNHRPAWQFHPTEKQSDRLVERCMPYFVVKVRQAQLYIRYRALQRALYHKGPNIRWAPENMKALREIRSWFWAEFRKANARGTESVEANTLGMISEQEVMKIESDLQGNLQRASGDTAPPPGMIQ